MPQAVLLGKEQQQHIMLRKCTAISFLMVMIMLIALKHPVLGYCLCLDAYFTGDCVCQHETRPSAKRLGSAPTCPDCCPDQSQGNTDTPREPSEPCDDCTAHLTVDVGDFVWDNSNDTPADTGSTILPPLAYAEPATAHPAAVIDYRKPIRGDPPPYPTVSKVPLFLRHSVMRL
ncbi:MAG: hypothetical protein H7A51_08045 [Akkermansiaceae bacterium]|nr:hypothetical protein [Akkermansiaceae bacterium]